MSAAKRPKLMEAKEKKFVIKASFTDIHSMEKEVSYDSEIENHFNIDWHTSVVLDDESLCIYLDCPKIVDNDEYTIETKIDLKLRKNTGEEELESTSFEFSDEADHMNQIRIHSTELNDYLIDGNLAVEFTVTIIDTIGIEEYHGLKKFDESNEGFSDVVLIVEDKKFYVLKKFLACHSTYFNSTFFGKFDEANKAEIEIEDTSARHFQDFLDLIYGFSLVNDDTVYGILHLADFFDLKTAMKRCEDFLLNLSKKTPKEKFELAMKYKFDNLAVKSVSEIKSLKDFCAIVADNIDELEHKLSNEWLKKAVSLIPG